MEHVCLLAVEEVEKFSFLLAFEAKVFSIFKPQAHFCIGLAVEEDYSFVEIAEKSLEVVVFSKLVEVEEEAASVLVVLQQI